MRIHRARGSAELSEVASGSATQGFWLRNGLLDLVHCDNRHSFTSDTASQSAGRPSTTVDVV